jgi:hypothetical protein
MSNLKIMVGSDGSAPGAYSVGQVVAVSAIDARGICRPARRLVNADGSPRADLTRVRVVTIHAEARRFTPQMLADGAGPVDTYCVEVS